MHRRAVLGMAAAAALCKHTATAQARGIASLVIAWTGPDGRHRAGLLRASRASVAVVAEVELPGRPHALRRIGADEILVVARRPGAWLLRWRPVDGRVSLHWMNDDRRLCGHAVTDGRGRLLTTEMDLEHERGLLVVRDLDTLQADTEWRTCGIDPHDLLLDADGSMLVANGGVPTRPETGRVKLDRAAMDSSLVRLSAIDGRLLGQWRLPDARLSIRHLARHRSGRVGIALQAEHDSAEERAAAPVVAQFDGHCLTTLPASRGLAGYAGDISATDAGYAVGATRADRNVTFNLAGLKTADVGLPKACAQTEAWSMGLQLLHRHSGERVLLPVGLRVDNHATSWEG